MRRPLVVLSALSLLAVPVALLPSFAGADAGPTDTVSMTFDPNGAASSLTGTGVDLANTGTAATTAQVVSSGGGSIVPGVAADGTLSAVRFPYYNGGQLDSPRAVIAVTNTTGTDELTPAGRAFSFGTDIRLAATNHGSAYDNGNNILQRGLFGSGAQYKLQLDGSDAGCRVEGATGSLTTKVPVSTRAWFRLGCDVTVADGSDTLTITATPIADDGSLGTPETSSVSGPVGALTYDPATPLTVGGKLDKQLTLQASADQFNGRLDNAWVQLG